MSESTEVVFGSARVQIDGFDLRYLRVGSSEVVRRLQFAVRDRNWGTLTPLDADLELQVRRNGFDLSVDALYDDGDIRLRWRGRVVGTANSITAEGLGRAERAFLFNRVGFCILHPPSISGCGYRTNGVVGSGTFPETIAPQPIQDGLPAPFIPAFTELAISDRRGATVAFEFDGDYFEVEDQRNWIDASFKTYSTPLSLGFPHQAQVGDAFQQRVRITWPRAAAPADCRDIGPRIPIGECVGRPPSVGLSLPEHASPVMSPRDEILLRALAPRHLRLELPLGTPCDDALIRGAGVARLLNATLELVLFVGSVDEIDPLRDLLTRSDVGSRVVRVLALDAEGVCAPAGLVAETRRRLAPVLPGAAFGGGTNAWFTDLNRNRPCATDLDFVEYSVSPTVHADDDLSLVETTTVVGDTVRSAREFLDNTTVGVGPITLRPRFNPVATAETYNDPTKLPASVDCRQAALVGAAWTLGTIKGLAESGARFATFYETVGWRGVVQGEFDPKLPDLFPGRRGDAYPLFHVLADVIELEETTVQRADSTLPLVAQVLALRSRDALHLLVANMKSCPTSVCVEEVTGRGSIRALDERTLELARSDPLGFRTASSSIEANGQLELDLLPFAYTRVDLVEDARSSQVKS